MWNDTLSGICFEKKSRDRNGRWGITRNHEPTIVVGGWAHVGSSEGSLYICLCLKVSIVKI